MAHLGSPGLVGTGEAAGLTATFLDHIRIAPWTQRSSSQKVMSHARRWILGGFIGLPDLGCGLGNARGVGKI